MDWIGFGFMTTNVVFFINKIIVIYLNIILNIREILLFYLIIEIKRIH